MEQLTEAPPSTPEAPPIVPPSSECERLDEHRSRSWIGRRAALRAPTRDTSALRCVSRRESTCHQGHTLRRYALSPTNVTFSAPGVARETEEHVTTPLPPVRAVQSGGPLPTLTATF